MAFGILGSFALGTVMSDLPFSPEKLQYFAWHKWAGVSIFILVWARLLWRLYSQVPAYLPSLSARTQHFAQLMHAVLYGLMIVIPLTGWLMSSAKGVQTVWFGLWPIPDLLQKDKPLGQTLELVHSSLNWVFMALIMGHAAMALKHHLIDRDDTLRRMLPSRASIGNADV